MATATALVHRERPAVDDPTRALGSRTRQGRGQLVDYVLPLVAALLVLLPSLSNTDLQDGRTGVWQLVVLLGQSLPLLFVRRAPRTVLAVTAGATTAQLASGLPLSNGDVAQAVAVAVVVARSRWPWSAAVPAGVLVVNIGAAVLGQVPDLSRFVGLTATSLTLGWVLGDAARRRAAVRQSMRLELQRRSDHAELRGQVEVMSERLSIARGLHDRVGATLDAVVVQAGAARRRLPEGDSVVQVTAIESVTRAALDELDRFLTLLRGDPPAPVAVGPPVGAAPQVQEGRATRWLASRAPALAPVAVAGVVAVLTLIDVTTIGQAHGLPGWWPAAFTIGVAVPLLVSRRWPQLVLLVVTTVVLTHLGAGVPVDNGVVAVPVALYAVTSRGPRRRAALWAAAVLTAIVLVVLRVDPVSTLPTGTVVLAMLAIAFYLGDTARVAREHDDTLRQRLEDVEEQGRLRTHAAVVAERTRAARELHDSLGHALSLIVVQAGAARLAAADRSRVDVVQRALSVIERSARSALEELDATLVAVRADTDYRAGTRQVPGAVVPMSDVGYGADEARTQPADDLAGLVDAVRAAGVDVTLVSSPTADLPRSLQMTVYRVMQEALTNVVKHAPGAVATVTVARQDGRVLLTVRNGPGIGEPSRLPSGGRGLTGMRERLALLGGRLDAGPAASGGYVVHADLPDPAGTLARSSAPEPRKADP